MIEQVLQGMGDVSVFASNVIGTEGLRQSSSMVSLEEEG